MTSKPLWTMQPLALTAGAFCLALAVVSAGAQVQTQTTTTTHPSTVQTTVEHGEVEYVEGNDMIVKRPDGTLLHLANVPDSARITLDDGSQIGIHDVKVGMKLQRTITTTTTPKTITTTQTVTGKVVNVMPPTSVILQMENGENQQFKIPKDQKFNVDGQMVDAWGLRKGMNISATKVVETPETHISREQSVTGSLPPPPPPPAPNEPILVAAATPPPTPAAAPTELPKTASPFPGIAMLGFLSLATSLGLRLLRRVV